MLQAVVSARCYNRGLFTTNPPHRNVIANFVYMFPLQSTARQHWQNNSATSCLASTVSRPTASHCCSTASRCYHRRDTPPDTTHLDDQRIADTRRVTIHTDTTTTHYSTKLKETNRPNLTTLPRHSIRRTSRIIKSRMSHKLRPTRIRIISLEQNRLILLHIWEIVPLMPIRVSHDIILSSTIFVTKVELEEIFWRSRSDIAHC